MKENMFKTRRHLDHVENTFHDQTNFHDDAFEIIDTADTHPSKGKGWPGKTEDTDKPQNAPKSHVSTSKKAIPGTEEFDEMEDFYDDNTATDYMGAMTDTMPITVGEISKRVDNVECNDNESKKKK